MFAEKSRNLHNEIDNTLPLLNGEKNKIDTLLDILHPSFPYTNEQYDIVLLRLEDLWLKQMKLEDKINHIEKDIITHELIDNYKKQIEQYQVLLTYIDNLSEFKNNWPFFRTLIWKLCLDDCNWKSLIHSIYHIEYLINNINHYQMKEFILNNYKIVTNSLMLFIKDLITIQINPQKHRFHGEEQNVLLDIKYDIILN